MFQFYSIETEENKGFNFLLEYHDWSIWKTHKRL